MTTDKKQVIVDEAGAIPRGLFDLLPDLEGVEGIEGMEAVAQEFSSYINERIDSVALNLYISGEKPDRAWVYTNREGQVFLAQGKDRGDAYRIIEEASNEYPTSSELKRCRAMDGLGYNELWGLYSGLVNVVPCANPFCGAEISILGSGGNTTSGRLVDERGHVSPIVIGTDLYCSRECYESRR
jgi:hypothetical protein